MPDTTPLRRTPIGADRGGFKDVETNKLSDHYITAAKFYGNRQYADIALILRGKTLN